MQHIEVRRFGLALGLNPLNEPASVILSRDSVESGGEYLMSSNYAMLKGTTLSIVGDSVVVQLLDVNDVILDALRAKRLPLALLDPKAHDERLIEIRREQ